MADIEVSVGDLREAGFVPIEILGMLCDMLTEALAAAPQTPEMNLLREMYEVTLCELC